MTQLAATRFHFRESRRGRRDPAAELTRTHRFRLGDTFLADRFPLAMRRRPVTFSFQLYNPAQVVLSSLTVIGNLNFSADVVGFFLQNTSIVVVTGGPTTDTNNRVTANLPIAVAELVNSSAGFNLVYAVNPGTGQVRMWVNGTLVFRAASLSGGFTDSTWAGGLNGSTLSGAAAGIIPEFNVFAGQTPAQSDW